MLAGPQRTYPPARFYRRQGARHMVSHAISEPCGDRLVALYPGLAKRVACSVSYLFRGTVFSLSSGTAAFLPRFDLGGLGSSSTASSSPTAFFDATFLPRLISGDSGSSVSSFSIFFDAAFFPRAFFGAGASSPTSSSSCLTRPRLP